MPIRFSVGSRTDNSKPNQSSFIRQPPMLPQSGMQGHAEAKEIDRIIQRMLDKDPITKDNALRWLTFATIVEASCKAIKKQAEDRMG